MKFKSACSNTRVGSSNPYVKIKEFRLQLYELRVQIHKLQLQIHELRLQPYELWFQIYEFWIHFCELQVQIQRLKSTSSKIIGLIKTEGNSLKISSLPKTPNLKSFVNSWDNSYVPFLVIISCFAFPIFYACSFSWKQSEKILTLKEET